MIRSCSAPWMAELTSAKTLATARSVVVAGLNIAAWDVARKERRYDRGGRHARKQRVRTWRRGGGIVCPTGTKRVKRLLRASTWSSAVDAVLSRSCWVEGPASSKTVKFLREKIIEPQIFRHGEFPRWGYFAQKTDLLGAICKQRE